MRWEEHTACMGEKCLENLKESPGQMQHRQEENSQTDLREIGWGIWIGFIWLRQG
jgi:hypothetical protein